ncbi:hypothetical protein M501DRAFT_1020915 [Patellaria atrata CBS 101060]|uniref:Uncharacterized protein n=1 Tax=Patellaria atrata CBS 101060 TaxID=1346257 RepID=A0A9P4S157_9PEZI|nr:hypothetical protein M501DRAFT_1020915 [Patellaria atrata CBS 101060]
MPVLQPSAPKKRKQATEILPTAKRPRFANRRSPGQPTAVITSTRIPGTTSHVTPTRGPQVNLTPTVPTSVVPSYQQSLSHTVQPATATNVAPPPSPPNLQAGPLSTSPPTALSRVSSSPPSSPLRLSSPAPDSKAKKARLLTEYEPVRYTGFGTNIPDVKRRKAMRARYEEMDLHSERARKVLQ